MPGFLIKKQATFSNSDNEGENYYAGEVLSDWEVPDLVKEKINSGIPHYTAIFEKLSDKEAELFRKKATAIEGARTSQEGGKVDPPWDDYVGLHPKDVTERMKNLSADDAEKVRQYERAGLMRAAIIEHIVPSEREPWHEYDNWGPRDILDKLDILDPIAVQDVIVYEMQHKKRPAILTYIPEEDGDEVHTSLSKIETSIDDEKEEDLVSVGASDEAED